MFLPTEKNKPKDNLIDYPIFLYGVSKIGKSTLASEIEGNLFFNATGGLEALEVYEVKINTWEDFLNAGAEFIKGEHNFKSVTLDTIDRLHKLCVNYIVTKHGIQHPQDLDFGKGYDIVKDEFIRPLTKLALSNYGLIMISHVREVEIKTRTAVYTKAIPTLQTHIWELVNALAGVVLYMTTVETPDGKKRMLRTSPSENWIAGDRTRKLLSFGDIEVLAGSGNWDRVNKIFKQEIKKEAKS
jgi:hypothetical protein